MKLISIVFDNYFYNRGLKATWGFSCLIQGFEKTVLFDTGSNGGVLLSNMRNLGLNSNNIDSVFISHDHWDHTGGLKSILSENSMIDVYMLPSFSSDLKNTVKEYGAYLLENNDLKMLFPRVYTTGILGTTIHPVRYIRRKNEIIDKQPSHNLSNGVKEQSLIIETKNGLVIITGCAHPGVVNIIQHVKKSLNQKIYMAFGGFHLGSTRDSELKDIISQFRKMEVEKAGPCHCSGDRCRELFANEYKENFLDIGVGKIIEIE